MVEWSRGSAGVARACPESRGSHLELAAAPSAVRIARHWTANQLASAEPILGDDLLDPDLLDAVVLVVSELVTNAINAVLGPYYAGLADSEIPEHAVSRPTWLLPDGSVLPTAAVSAGASMVPAFFALAPAAAPTDAPAPTPSPAPPPLAPQPEPAHTSATVSLVLSCTDGIVRLEVRDSSPVPLPPTHDADADDENGRGLTVVDALAKSWGWQSEAFGKVVWCELGS